MRPGVDYSADKWQRRLLRLGWFGDDGCDEINDVGQWFGWCGLGMRDRLG